MEKYIVSRSASPSHALDQPDAVCDTLVQAEGFAGDWTKEGEVPHFIHAVKIVLCESVKANISVTLEWSEHGNPKP
jgi:hypothetical protein